MKMRLDEHTMSESVKARKLWVQQASLYLAGPQASSEMV